MLAFDSNEFLNHSEDKGLDFSTSAFEDAANDLFNQYLSPDSPEPSDSVDKGIDFQAFDFSLGDGLTFDGNALGDKAGNIQNGPILRRARRVVPKGLRCTQSQEILPSQIYQKFARFDRPQAAISGLELLTLEGKIAPPRVPVTTSFAAAAPTPIHPLRRKARFSANPSETLRHRQDQVTKGFAANSGETSKMMRPSHYYQNKMPSFQEWSQELEQIMVQRPLGDVPMALPSANGFPLDDKRPRNMPLARPSQPISRPQEVYDPSLRSLPGTSMPDLSERDALSFGLVPAVPPQAQRSVGMSSTGQQGASYPSMEIAADGSVPAGLSPSFVPASTTTTSTESFQYMAPPAPTPTGVVSASTCYYGNLEASQSAPVLAQARSMDFCTNGIISPDLGFDQFITEDPSNEYFIIPNELLFSPQDDDNIFPPFPSPPLFSPPFSQQQRPRTPSSRSSSVCRPPSPTPTPTTTTPKSPSKPHHNHHHHLRRQRSSKSLRRKSSAGGPLKSAGPIDFVNFTPHDSARILSGVAPSGSSKTKARREQESIDRKRKLSLAAEKAVKDAGGDVEQLRAAGVFAGLGE